MSATDLLREDHRQIRRLEEIIITCYKKLDDGAQIPLQDIARIIRVIEEFLDSIHYSREEDSYLPCVAGYGHLRQEIRVLLIEHEFSRRVAAKLREHLRHWRDGNEEMREPVARYLRTYSIYLYDHMTKEEALFNEAEAETLSAEEEREMYEQFSSVVATSKRLAEMLKEIDYLESQPWASR